MSDTPDPADARPEHSAEHPDDDEDHGTEPGQRRRRRRRVVLVSLGSVLGLAIVAVVGIFAYLNHMASSIPRIPVHHLVPGAAAQTFLITADPYGPTGTSNLADSQSSLSNLVMLLHIDANGENGGAVTIPGDTRVNVPGIGTEPLWNTLKQGGPSLLVQTVTQVTGIPINHYARIDFSHITGLVNAIGGVDVTVPAATKGFGYNFTAGVNHLTGVNAIYYARDPALSDEDRLLRQESLLRAVLSKIADDHLLINPVTTVHVLSAITTMLAVDSDMSNSEIVSLAREFGNRNSSGAIYVTAPTLTMGGKTVLNAAIDDQLWTAVKHDSIPAFAKKYPSTVTPEAAP